MPRPRISDEEFAVMFQRLGAAGTARELRINIRNVFARRREVEARLGVELTPPGTGVRNGENPARLLSTLQTGTILVGSDAHYWPGDASTGHRAFCTFAKRLRPQLIVLNGDVIDGASISRHPPIGWEDQPTVQEEIEACQERLAEIEEASPKSRRAWCLGNHDARFETRLASVAPEYARVHGVHLKDHFPNWEPCWSVSVGPALIKHRFKGGIHATHNNTLWAGRSIVTGHLHSLKVTPLTDYNGTRFGVDCGTLADPSGPQFEGYTEDNPLNWRQGFVVLTLDRGRLLWPEVVHVLEPGLVEFRGKLEEV